MKLTRLTTLMLAFAATATHADGVPFTAYLDAVEQRSLELAAQRETVQAARAGVSIAALPPDPSLSWGVGPREFSREVTPKPPLGQSLSLSWTVETAGKRGRRVRAAESGVALAQANVEGFMHTLYGNAAGAFAEACRSREALLRQEAALKALSDVVRANEVRRKAGDLGGLELLQSRTERDQYHAAVVKARADAQVARLNLALPLSGTLASVFGEQPLACEFQTFDAGDDMSRLVEQALQQRDDVRIARATLANARDAADLARANRYVDPSVSLSYAYAPHGRDGTEADGSPVSGASRTSTLSLSVSVPIPLSRLQRGELVQAESAVTQALLLQRQAELKAEADVRGTHAQFQAARENLARYRDNVVADSQKVLDGMRLSYRNGAASLLELLNAQRSADDVYLAYLQAQADLANATVQLQLSLGRRPGL
jgi:cobalt-zinc-cadmium efflux system outer membrane protein